MFYRVRPILTYFCFQISDALLLKLGQYFHKMVLSELNLSGDNFTERISKKSLYRIVPQLSPQNNYPAATS